MAIATDTHVRVELEEQFHRCEIVRPLRQQRYEPGTKLSYDVRGVVPDRSGRVELEVVRFVGGGFAGQVYRIRVLEIQAPDGPIAGLEPGGEYAMKILVPPSRFSQMFRDVIYRVGFQAPFSLQVSPAAARAGALWQKFIRRATAGRFGRDDAVVDIHATFVDDNLGSCGEISEWVDGRVWRFEVNDRLDELRQWRWNQPIDNPLAGSPEYRAKRVFMARFVQLLHEIGAHEFARQYEWWTCKSQPNALKRNDAGDDPHAGLTAVDFRAGLALLPFLPMSPGDFRLILTGLRRGRWVQFDRGDLAKLQRHVEAFPALFEGMESALNELKATEKEYRDGQLDIAHHHVRLLGSGRLWSAIGRYTRKAWDVKGTVDEAMARRVNDSWPTFAGFWLLGLLPGLCLAGAASIVIACLWNQSWPVWAIATAGGAVVAAPLLRMLRGLWGRADLRKHYTAMVQQPGYFGRAFRAHVIERAIGWHRQGRLSDEGARSLASSPGRYILHRPLSVLPVFLHRMLTDPAWAKQWAANLFVRPIRLYFNAESREQWLRDMVDEGLRKHMLTREDADRILDRIKEPFIQKYLKSLAVHVCTLPVTQVVSVAVAVWYKVSHNLPWGEAWDEMLLILAVFQVTPISPGSLVRGLYVLYLVIRERNFKDYNIAVFMGFFKYIGYLSFPIQMAYRYPALARFMAGHWATGAVHIVPVFGEHGALMEHAVFDLFYNYPLTVRRRIREREEQRRSWPVRWWHVPAIMALGIGLFAAEDVRWLQNVLHTPWLKQIWWMALLVPLVAGSAITAFARGASLRRRIVSALLGGVGMGFGYAAVRIWMYHSGVAMGSEDSAAPIDIYFWGPLWRIFIFGIFSVVGALLTEILWPAMPPDVDEPAEDAGGSEKGQENPQEHLADDIGVDAGEQVIGDDAQAER